jgi:nicotinamidase-related amidase
MLTRAADSLLVTIDIQERLVAAMPEAAASGVLHNAGILLQAAGRLGIPVLATAQYPKGLGPMHEAVRAHLPAGTPVFDKTSFSCCAADAFMAAVAASGRRQAVLMGMETHVCVLQTAAGLRHAGVEVFVVEDAVCSRTEANRQNGLARLRQAGIAVTNTESVLFEWLGDARHPDFKILTALIK